MLHPAESLEPQAAELLWLLAFSSSNHGDADVGLISSAIHPLARLSLRAVLKEINEPVQIGAPCRTVVTWSSMLSRLQKELFELLNFWIKCLGHTGDGRVCLLPLLRRET